MSSLKLSVPGKHHGADDREGQRDLVADHLRGAAQPAEQRVLVVARPAGDEQADHRQAEDGEEVDDADVEVGGDGAGRERA